MKKGVLSNFTKLARKQLFQSLFFNKVADLGFAALLTLIRLGFLKVVFPGGWRWGGQFDPLDISRRTYSISIKLYTIVKQSI